jgi:inosine-uridine nucleoside N-ribohydrolase
MQNIIIDTDPGVDDAQAIAFAIAHPEINLLGLTTVFGNATIDITTGNALTLLELFGRPDIPVAQGASQPLVQQRMASPDFVHGADGMGNLNLAAASGRAIDETAAEFIVRTVAAQPGEVSLVAIGPLTNIAEALALDPSLPSKTKELVIMGGTVDEPGNVSPVAEANFLGDPHAADIVFSVDWPATIIGLDVTHRTLLRDRDFAELRDHAKGTGRLLWDSSRFYIDFYSTARDLSGDDERSCAMHDASTVVYLLERDAFECVSGPARVVNDGVAVGQLIVDREGHEYPLPHWQNRPAVRVAMKVDSERVRKTFIDTIVEYALV